MGRIEVVFSCDKEVVEHTRKKTLKEELR